MQVFFGPPDTVEPWFHDLGYAMHDTAASLSDWMLDTVSIDFQDTGGMSTMEDVSRAAMRVKESTPLVERSINEPVKGFGGRVSWVRQFVVLLMRCSFAQLRNPTDAAARLLVATWVGLLTGRSLRTFWIHILLRIVLARRTGKLRHFTRLY